MHDQPDRPNAKHEPDDVTPVTGEDDDVGPTGVDVWLVPFVTDSTLWPVLIVALAAAVSLGVALVTITWSDGNPLGIGGILAIGWMSFDMVKRERQLGGSGWVTRLVLAVWFLTGVSSGALIALGWI